MDGGIDDDDDDDDDEEEEVMGRRCGHLLSIYAAALSSKGRVPGVDRHLPRSNEGHIDCKTWMCCSI